VRSCNEVLADKRGHDAFVCAIMGPIGSGKSVACVMKLIRNVQKQTVGEDGWKRRRTAVIRNTYPELRTTTIKTWHQWVPPSTGTTATPARPRTTSATRATRPIGR
jgi:hypothetical protein